MTEDQKRTEMIDVSRAIIRTWKCECGFDAQAREWVTIDCKHRPELVAEIKGGSRLFPACPSCGKEVTSRENFALARLSDSVPLVLVQLDKKGQKLSNEMIAYIEEVYLHFQEEYGSFPRLKAPVTILDELLQRDIDSDLKDGSSAPGSKLYSKFIEVTQSSYEHEKRIQALREHAQVRTLDEAESLLKKHPELLEERTNGILRALAAQDSILAGLYNSQIDFLLQASSDFEAAYEKFIEVREQFIRSQLYGPVEELREQIESLHATGEWQKVVALAERGLEFARPAKNDFLIAEFCYNAASAICNAPTSTPQDLENARKYLEEALGTETGRKNAIVYLQMSTVYSSRSIGDPYKNMERGITLAEDGLTMFDTEKDPELWAMAQTNLALLYQRRHAGNRRENLERAVFLCEEALRVRSPEVNTDDWAFTMLNLGVVKTDLCKITKEEPTESLECYQALLAEENNIVRRELVARAHYNIGCIKADQAKSRAADADVCDLIQEAIEHLHFSIEDHKHNPLLLAETHARLAELAHLQGDADEEEREYVAALSYITPDHSADKYEAIASAAAARAAEVEDWTKAADRYQLALKAAKIQYEGCINQERREKVLRTAAYLSRWAAAALARAGNIVHAAEVLEAGKAHALGVRAEQENVDAQLLRDVSPQLAEKYRDALAGIVVSRGMKATSGAIEYLNSVVSDIRAIDGMANFLRRTSLTDISDAVLPDYPVVYLNPTPHGTMVLIADQTTGSEDDVSFSVDFLPITSKKLIENLIIDFSTEKSYFIEAMMGHEDIAAIENGLRFVGEEVMRGVASLIQDKRYLGLTLITSGPLSMLPVHFAQWQENGNLICLNDGYTIRYAPSAHLAAVSYQKWKARESQPHTLVAIANPNKNNPLKYSEAEVTEIKTLFPEAHVRTGSRATVEFLGNFAIKASHLHLACHGRVEPWDYRSSIIELADGNVTIEDLVRRGSLVAQLAVASACQTAVIDQFLAEEGFSIGGALLAAGSAAVIASSWPVDDFTTALLMIRFYKILMSSDNSRPAEVLRQAQIWLRELSQADLMEFLKCHTAFSSRTPSYEGDKPFASPYYWGAFTVLGG